MNTPLHPQSPSLPVSKSPDRLQPRPLTAGTHIARCSAIIDLGTHTDAPTHRRTDAPGKSQRKLLLTFTLFAADGSTQRLSRQFTHSCDIRSSLSKFLTPWLGHTWKHSLPVSKSPSLKVSAIAETPCLIVLQASEALNPRTGQPYLNITAASPLIAGITVPDLKWPASIFSLKAPNREVFKSLPTWIKTKIATSHEWHRLKQSSAPTPSIPRHRLSSH